MRWRSLSRTPVRPLGRVPAGVRWLLAAAFAGQLAWQAMAPGPAAEPRPLPPAPDARLLAALSLGEPSTVASGLLFWLQTRDDQPGARQSFHDLDYTRLAAWLRTLLTLDPASERPLMLAVRVYGQVTDPARQRTMLDFVHDAFRERPAERWRWLAEAAIIARHRLDDTERALRYARSLTEHTEPGDAPIWARDLQSIILEDTGEYEAAAIVLGGLLDAGEIDDPRELDFLRERLERLKKRAAETEEGNSVDSE